LDVQTEVEGSLENAPPAGERFSPVTLKPRVTRLLQAVSSGAAARILSAAVTFVSLPLAVRYLGAERYGVWATVTTTVVWISLLDLGIANSLTNLLSRDYAFGDKRSAARHFSNALVLSVGIALGVGLCVAIAFPHCNWTELLKVSEINSAEVRSTIAVALALMLFGLPCNLGSKILAGYQEVHRNNYVVGGSAAASVVGLALGIGLHVSMPILFVMSAGCMTFGSFFNLVWLLIWKKPWLGPRISFVNRGTMRTLLNSGWSLFLIQIAGVVVFGSDNLVVSHYLGASEVTPYSVAWRLVGVAAILQSLLFPALWPAYAEAYARSDYNWIRGAFRFTLRASILLNLGCLILVVSWGRILIRIWAGAAAVPSYALLLAMALWALISGVMSAESCLLAALNQTREQAVLSVVAAAANILLSILMVKRVGSVGVILGTILSYLSILLIPQSLMVRRLLKQELSMGTSERTILPLSEMTGL
jgi:O-antigen/teichoic acid export membrane protein